MLSARADNGRIMRQSWFVGSRRNSIAFAPLVITIQSVAAGVPTFSNAAVTTVAGGVAAYGTDDTTAIQNWINSVAEGGVGYREDGLYMIDGPLQTAATAGDEGDRPIPNLGGRHVAA